MSKRDELIETFTADLRERIGSEPEADLLRAVTVATEPAIYDPDAATVSSSDTDELNRVCESFVMGKLGVADHATAMGALQKVIRDYDRSNPRKHRVSLYYMLVKHFGKEDLFV